MPEGDPASGSSGRLKTAAAILGSLAAIATATAGLVAVFAGNGTSNGPDGGGPTVTTHDETEPTLADWSREANAICRPHMRKLRALGRPTTDDELVVYLQAAIPLSEAVANRLRALEEPSESSERIAEMLDLWDQSREAAQEAVAAARSGNQAAARSAWETGVEMEIAAARVAADLGALNCAEPAFE